MSPTRPDPQVQALVAAQDAARTALVAQLVAMAVAPTRDFTGWYDTAAITSWAGQVTGAVESLQRALARSTDAYLARVATLLTGRRVRPVGAVDVSTLRAGVTHPGAYARAADAYRWQQSRVDAFAPELTAAPELDLATLVPPDLIAPAKAAVDRVAAVAEMDMQLAVRAQAQAFMTAQAAKPPFEGRTLTGYRRVIHPELSKGGVCGLCAAASTRLYGPKELMPIHARCKCVPMPVYDGNDPGSVINTADLGKFYEDAGGTTDGPSLKRTRYQVDEHGELGPVLNPQGAKLRSHVERKQTREAARKVKAEATAARKLARLQKVFDQQSAALPRAQRLAGANPAVWGDYATQLEARVADLQRQLAA